MYFLFYLFIYLFNSDPRSITEKKKQKNTTTKTTKQNKTTKTAQNDSNSKI